MLTRPHSADGFTLIETLASLLVFALVTLGVVPLMLSATRASSLSRSFTVGKNVAVEAMERARGLPFYVSRGVQPNDVDFLDLYHPAPPNAGDFYKIDCDSTSTASACPRGLPDAYEITFRTRFVTVAADGTLNTVPSTGYSAAAAGTDSPPSRLTQFIVTSNWVLGAEVRTFQMETLIGDRKFGGAETNGFARINYAVRVSTSFDSPADSEALAVTAGAAESRIETRRQSTASQSATAALLRLFDPEASENPDVIPPVQGATITIEAPPDYNPPPAGASEAVLDRGGSLGAIAAINDTVVGASTPAETDVLVVANDTGLPVAQGGYMFGGSEPLDLWVDKPEAHKGLDSRLRLLDETATGNEVFQVPAGIQSFLGYTDAVTTALPGGAISTTAHAEVAEARLFPTHFAPLGVLQIVDFEADVVCEGEAEGLPGGTAQASWSATIRYWSAEANDYVSQNLTQDSAGALDTIRTQNPLVFEDTTDPTNEVEGSAPGDVYLFPQPHDHVVEGDEGDEGDTIVSHNHAGYLQAWRSSEDVTAAIDADGRTASAGIVDALSFDSVPLPVEVSPYTPTPLNISLGTLSCQAVDFR